MKNSKNFFNLDALVEVLLENDEFIEQLSEKVLSKNEVNHKNKPQTFKEEKRNHGLFVGRKNNTDDYYEKILERDKKIKELEQENFRLSKQVEEISSSNKNLNLKLQKIEAEYIKIAEENKNFDNKYEELREQAISKLNKYKNELDYKERELANQKNIIEEQNEKLSKNNNQFSDIKRAYNLFLEIDSEIKEDIISMLKGDAIENFAYAGVQQKNIEKMWDYAKGRAVNNQLNDLDKLSQIIKFFLNAFNMTYNSPMYKIQEVNIGDNFEEESFIRGYESKITGRISRIDLFGYVNVNTGKIEKKSVVII